MKTGTKKKDTGKQGKRKSGLSENRNREAETLENRNTGKQENLKTRTSENTNRETGKWKTETSENRSI